MKNKQPQKRPADSGNKLVKAYNMVVSGETSAEINMYGNVVATVPKDWKTGERIAGYIGLDEFLEDLKEIKDKDNITVHINSGGGDLYAGLAIYNRLKSLNGTLTTINDGLAASAASLIFQAGDTRQMNAGSNLMAHGVSGFLFGYYNIDDLEELAVQFRAHNKAIVNVYAEAMGVSYEEAKGFIEGETWLTGDEAVEKGLADEVISEGSGETLEDSLMQKLIARMGEAYKAQFPNTAITAAVPPIAHIENTNETGGMKDMSFKTVEELRNAHPDLVAQIENAARDGAQKAGTDAERQRIQAIEAIENTIADKDLINEAKYGENPMTAEQLALAALQAQAQIGANMLDNLDTDAQASGAADVQPAPSGIEGNEPSVEDAAKGIAEIYNSMKGVK